MENNTATSEYNLEENDELYQCVDPKEIFGQEILLKANLSTFIDGNQNTAHEITSKGEQVEDSSRTWLDFNLVDPPKKTCKNDRLFLEAKQHNPPKKIVPFGSKLTIIGSKDLLNKNLSPNIDGSIPNPIQDQHTLLESQHDKVNSVPQNNSLAIFDDSKQNYSDEISLSGQLIQVDSSFRNTNEIRGNDRENNSNESNENISTLISSTPDYPDKVSQPKRISKNISAIMSKILSNMRNILVFYEF